MNPDVFDKKIYRLYEVVMLLRRDFMCDKLVIESVILDDIK